MPEIERIADLVATTLNEVAIETTTVGGIGPPRDDVNIARVRISDAAAAIASALSKDFAKSEAAFQRAVHMAHHLLYCHDCAQALLDGKGPCHVN